MRRWLTGVVALIIMCLAVAPACASVDLLYLEQQLKCPTCDTPLNVSSAPSALRIKAFIEEKAAQGWSTSQIEQSLVTQFGRDILATPPKSGFDLLVWLVPAAFVVAGLGALPFVARSWSSRRRTVAAVVAGVTPEEQQRLNEELRRRDL